MSDGCMQCYIKEHLIKAQVLIPCGKCNQDYEIQTYLILPGITEAKYNLCYTCREREKVNEFANLILDKVEE